MVETGNEKRTKYTKGYWQYDQGQGVLDAELKALIGISEDEIQLTCPFLGVIEHRSGNMPERRIEDREKQPGTAGLATKKEVADVALCCIQA
ncbi:MAG: hypothetical protein WA996_26215 [Candidatus Promineifilaceae bacterium]